MAFMDCCLMSSACISFHMKSMGLSPFCVD